MSDMLKRLMELADLPYTPKVVEPLVEAKEEELVPDQHAEGTLIEEEALSETAAAAAALIAQVDKGMPAKGGDSSSTFVPVDVAKMGDEKAVNELKPPEEKNVKVPSEITSQITQRIAEIKASIEKYNDKGYNDGGAKGNAVDALEQIKSDLAKGEDGFLAAQIFLGTLMNPITNLFPPKLIKFLANPMPSSVEKNTTVKEGTHMDDHDARFGNDYLVYYAGKSQQVRAKNSSAARVQFAFENGVPMSAQNSIEVSPTSDEGRCSSCGDKLSAPLVRDANGQLNLAPGLKCDCGATDSWMDSDDYQPPRNDRIDSPMRAPTQGEDRPGSGYEDRSDDTSERDGPKHDWWD